MSMFGQSQLTILAKHLRKLPKESFNMKEWLSRDGKIEFDWGSRKVDSTIAEVSNLIKNYRIQVCAVGLATSLRSFRDKGLKLVVNNKGAAGLRYVTKSHTYEAWDAVHAYFGLSEQHATYLFHASSYGKNVTPVMVADRIDEFVALEKAATKFKSLGNNSATSIWWC